MCCYVLLRCVVECVHVRVHSFFFCPFFSSFLFCCARWLCPTPTIIDPRSSQDTALSAGRVELSLLLVNFY